LGFTLKEMKKRKEKEMETRRIEEDLRRKRKI